MFLPFKFLRYFVARQQAIGEYKLFHRGFPSRTVTMVDIMHANHLLFLEKQWIFSQS